MTHGQRHTFGGSNVFMIHLFLFQSASAVPTLVLCAGSRKQQSTKRPAADVHSDAQTSEDGSSSDYAPAKRQRSVLFPAKHRGKGQKGGRQKKK